MTVSQSKFHTALLDPKQPVPEGLSDGLGQPAGSRFAVYRNNVASSLTEALEISFPVMQKLIGEENFKKVSAVFLRQHPPKVPMLSQYGDEMPGFLEGFKPLEHLGYLPDVARLEQALRVSYHAADASPIDPAALQALTPEEMAAARFGFAPSMILQRSRWPIHGIWVFNTEDAAPKPPAIAQSVLVLRPDFDPLPHLISEPTAACMAALMAGKSLSDAHDTAIEHDAGFDLGTLLGLLLGHGAITDIYSGEPV
jgi:hypothetical protein